MTQHAEISDHELRSKIRRKEIRLGGNSKLKIYGVLGCASGKRMKRENRVFFISEQEAQQHRYRPCAHCMKTAYKRHVGNLSNIKFILQIMKFIRKQENLPLSLTRKFYF